VLYERSKGRDLFDLWHVLPALDVDSRRIVWVREQYMGSRAFSYRQLRLNLLGKLADPDFRADLGDLIVQQPAGDDLADAADLVMERLGPHMRNAPPLTEIQDRAWRS